jgi:hypothetical protein
MRAVLMLFTVEEFNRDFAVELYTSAKRANFDLLLGTRVHYISSSRRH